MQMTDGLVDRASSDNPAKGVHEYSVPVPKLGDHALALRSIGLAEDFGQVAG